MLLKGFCWPCNNVLFSQIVLGWFLPFTLLVLSLSHCPVILLASFAYALVLMGLLVLFARRGFGLVVALFDLVSLAILSYGESMEFHSPPVENNGGWLKGTLTLQLSPPPEIFPIGNNGTK